MTNTKQNITSALFTHCKIEFGRLLSLSHRRLKKKKKADKTHVYPAHGQPKGIIKSSHKVRECRVAVRTRGPPLHSKNKQRTNR